MRASLSVYICPELAHLGCLCGADAQCMQNCKYVVNTAWKLGMSAFILWEDIYEAKPKMILIFIATAMKNTTQKLT